MSHDQHNTSQRSESFATRAPQRSSPAAADRSKPLNLTSMIDVVFLLLIYFVTTASFAHAEGIIIARMPETAGSDLTEIPQPPDAELPLKISLTSSGANAYRINLDSYPAAPVSFDALAGLLTQLRYDAAANPNGVYKADHPIVIQADGKVRWQHVTNAFNATVAAKYTNVRFEQTHE